MDFSQQFEFYALFCVMSVVTLVSVVILRRQFRARSTETSSDYQDATPQALKWMTRILGALWVLDGLLQAQPSMISNFATDILAPLASGQPPILKAAVIGGMKLWSLNPILWDELATWLQIWIGLAILLGGRSRIRRAGLWASLVWGLVVWISGEALGSIFVHGSWLSGSPGSVLFYMLAAICLLLPIPFWTSPGAKRAFHWSFASLWFLSALLQALPSSGWWNPSLLWAYVESMAEMPQPGILSTPLYAWARMLNAHPMTWNTALTGIFVILGVLWLRKPYSWMTWWISVLVTFATWWLGQDFGVLGGMGTDPNSGAIILAGLIVYTRLSPGLFQQQQPSSTPETTTTPPVTHKNY